MDSHFDLCYEAVHITVMPVYIHAVRQDFLPVEVRWFSMLVIG
jgi:hypothetical protein